MGKILLTPGFIKEFERFSQPPKITIFRGKIIFNLSSIDKLQLKKGDYFLLEYEDNQLFYKDSSKGFKLNITNKNLLYASAKGLIEFLRLNLLYKGEAIFKTAKSIRFIIGDFKDGRRPLIPQIKNKK